MKKNRIVQTVLVAIFALCTLFSAFITVLACTPVSTDVEISETVSVSSARLTAGLNPDYQVMVRGELRNTTGRTLMVERVEIPLLDEQGGVVHTLVLENVKLLPRDTVQITHAELITSAPAEKVGEITALVGGKSEFLRNPAEVALTFSLIPAALTLVFGFLLYRSALVRYYMYQEDRAKAAEQ